MVGGAGVELDRLAGDGQKFRVQPGSRCGGRGETVAVKKNEGWLPATRLAGFFKFGGLGKCGQKPKSQ